MKGLYALSFIITSTVCYSLGYRMGQYRPIKDGSEKSVKPIEVNLNFFQNAKKNDNWFFPCNVIHVEILERDNIDKKFYNEMCEFIKKFIHEGKNSTLVEYSTFVEYCKGSCIEQNDQN